jgi:nucleoside-diphosphate-sugar epimerase
VKVFVAGGSGVIGRRLLPQLAAAGHEVAATTRDESRAPALRELGATPVVCDVFDRPSLEEAVRSFEPEVVMHQLTDLPQKMNPRKLEEEYERNDRVRREGADNLLAAARAAGARRLVAQAIAFWYAPSGDGVPHGEEDPLYVNAPEPVGRSVRNMKAVEETILGDDAIEGVILRYGFFYGPGTWYTPKGAIGSQVLKRRYPIVGSGAGVFPFVHVDDAASATVAALAGPAGVYNVVDDDPAPMSEWLPEYADALGAPKPLRVPAVVAKVVAGSGPVNWQDQIEAADNAKAKRVLGWQPRLRSWRTGFREGLDEAAPAGR